MKRTITVLLMVIMLATTITACSRVSHENIGLVAGGVAGGALGSTIGRGNGRILATGVGAVVGGLVGKSIGQYMDRQDRDRMNRALETTRTGHNYRWRNPDTGYAYDVEPTRTYSQAGQPCRKFKTTATIHGKREHVYGTACRSPNGQWRIVS